MEETVKLFSRYRVPILVEKKQWETEKRSNKKKTHEEYIEELKVKNPNIEVIGKYVNVNAKIMHHCLKHNVYYETTPASTLQGCGCNICRKEKSHNKLTKTHEQYVAELENINPMIDVVDKYIDTNTPIKHYCRIHNIFWDARPQNLLNGQGCTLCGREKTENAIRKTHEQYVKEVDNLNSNINIIGTYINNHTSILHKCLIDGYEWNARPSDILRGSGCPKCKNNIKRTHEQYVEELSHVNPNVIALEQYVNFNHPILHLCKVHNIQWNSKPSSTLKGRGCNKCWRERNGKSIAKSNNSYVEELSKISPNIIVVEKYQKSNTPILHRCIICGYEWKTTPSSTLQGHGCPKCANNIKRTQEEYVKEVLEINPDIEVVGSYINLKTPIEHKCKIHNYLYTTSPSNVLSGCGTCKYCKESSGERIVRQWLETHNIDYIFQHTYDDCRDLYVLPFDFFLPTCNCIIEFDGQHHFEPIDFANKGLEWANERLKLTQYHDNIKNEYCKNNGISLLRIPYYKNIEEELNNFLFI